MSRVSFALLLPFAVASLAGCSDGPDVRFARSDDDVKSGREKEPGKGGSADEGSDTRSTPTPPAPRVTGVVFLHGTGDQGGVADYKCAGAGDDFHCAVKVAVDEYWVQATIDSERTRADGSRRPYAVLGCPLGSQAPWPNPKPVKGTGPEPGSAVCAADETARFLDGPDGKSGTADDITDIVLVTHSGGSNVVRYMLQQHASRPELDRIHKASRGFIGLAAPTTGTYLADWIFRNGSLPNVVNSLLAFAGGEGLYDDDGTHFIRTTAMNMYNRDPAKLVDMSKDVAGVPSYMGSGTIPTVRGDEAKVACGGETETKGLAVLHSIYLDEDDLATSRDSCSDGFISCRSAMALANGDISRVIFGRLDDGRSVGQTSFRAHNQSRRQCDGLDVDVRGTINKIFGEGSAKPTTFARALEGARLPFEPAFVAGVSDVSATQASTIRVARASTSESDDTVLVQIEVDVGEAANLGVRATLVATTADGEELVVSSEQAAAPSTAGSKVFTLRLPRAAGAGAGAKAERLSVRDVALVRHDDASTLALIPRVDLTAN